MSSDEGVAWREDGAGSAPVAPSPPSLSAPHAWLNRVTQEEEERKRRGMEEEEEEEEGPKGAAEEKEEEGRGKKEMHEKLSKLFSQPADPWASTGPLYAECSAESDLYMKRLLTEFKQEVMSCRTHLEAKVGKIKLLGSGDLILTQKDSNKLHFPPNVLVKFRI